MVSRFPCKPQRFLRIALQISGLTAFLVGIFYCLDALYGERRDRSILFWKSLPVSDLTAVLSKTMVALLILPLVIFVIIVATQLIMMLMTTVILIPSGLAGSTWTRLPIIQMSVVLLYGLITVVLWQVPIYGWLLLGSACVQGAAFLWAVLPWLALMILEKIAFNTGHVASMIGHRLTGSFENAFTVTMQRHGDAGFVPMVDRLCQLDPLKFLTSPGLWLGLVVTAAFLALAIRVRRYRGPL